MKYEEYAEDLGFENKDGIYVKNIKEYTLYLKDWQFMTLTIPSFYIPLDKSLDKEYIKKMIHLCDDNACASYGIGNEKNILIVSLADGNKKNKDVLDKINNEIEVTIRTLIKDGYNPMKLCPLSNEEHPYGKFGDDYIPISPEKRDEYISNLKSKIKVETGFTFKYVLSIILSIILAGVGMIPALLLCIYRHYYFTGFACLMPIGAVLGYYLSHAPAKKWLRITTGIIGFVFVIGFSIWSIPYMADAKNLSFTKYLTYHKLQGIRKIVFSILISFGGFGIMKQINKYKKDPNEELKKFEIIK